MVPTCYIEDNYVNYVGFGDRQVVKFLSSDPDGSERRSHDNLYKCHFKKHGYSEALLRLPLGSVRIMCDPRLSTRPIRDIALVSGSRGML